MFRKFCGLLRLYKLYLSTKNILLLSCIFPIVSWPSAHLAGLVTFWAVKLIGPKDEWSNLQWEKHQAIYFKFIWISKVKFRYSEKATFWISLPIFWHYLSPPPPSEELCTLSLYVIQNLITHPNLEDQKHSCSRSTQKERKSSCIKVSKSGRLSQGFMYLL